MILANSLAPELLDRLGWVLLHSLWQIAGVAGLLAVAMAVLRKRSAGLRYMVACAAMGITAGAPVLTFCLLGPDAPVAASSVQANTVAPSALPGPRPARELPALTMHPPVAPERNDVVPLPREMDASHDRAVLPAVRTAAPAPPSVPAHKRIAATLRPAMPWLAGLWLGGVMLLSIRGCWSWLATQRLRHHGASRVAANVGDILRELGKRMRLSRRVQILQSALVQVPTVIGWAAPVILLPASAISGMPAEQLRAILAHELAHIRRYDYLVNLMQTVVETLLFYHPAMWWIGRRIRAEREHCCDDMALAACGHRLAYAQALYSVARIGLAQGGLAVAADGGRPGTLLARIRRIAGQDAGDADRRATWLAGTLVLAGLLAGLVVYGRATAANSKAATTQPATAPTAASPDRLPAGAIARLGSPSFHTGGKITSIAFDVEARHVVADGDNLALFDAHSGEALMATHDRPPDRFAVAMSPDGLHFAVVQQSYRYEKNGHLGDPLAEWSVYETQTGQEVSRIRDVKALGYGPKGEKIVLKQNGDLVRLDAAGQRTGSAVPVADFSGGSPIFSADGRFIAGLFAYGAALWDTVAGKRVAEPSGEGDERSIIAFSPDSRTLAFGSNPNFKGHGGQLIRLFDLTRDGAPEFAKLNVEGQIEGMAFSPDGKQLAQTGEGVRIWDVATGKKVLTLAEGGRVMSAAFSKDGKRLATGDEVGIVRIYEMPAGKLLTPGDGPAAAMTGVCIVGDDKAATIDGSSIRLWELATGKQLRVIDGKGTLRGIASSPDGKLLASGGDDKLVHVWDAASGEEKMQFMRKSLTNAATTAVAFSPDGRLLAWGHEDGPIDVLDLGPDKLIRTFAGHKRQVTCLAFSPDSKRLASSSEDNTARVWDVAEAKQLYSVEADRIRANCVAFSPVGAMLAVGDWSGTIQLLDARTGKKQSELRLTASGGENLGTLASQFALAPDGKLLACGTHSGVIAFWDVASGMELVEKRLTGHRNWTHAVAFTRDGNKLISVSSDATGLVWDLGEGATGPASRPAGKGKVHELEPRQVRVELEPADDEKPGLFAIGPCDDRRRSIKSIYQAFGKGDIKPGHYWAVGRLNGTLYDSDKFETISYQQVGNEVTARVAVVASLFGGRPNQKSSGYIYLELPQLAAGLHTLTINFVDAHKENGKLVFAPPDAPARVMPLSCTIDLRGTAKEMIETVSKPRYFPNMGGHESQVQIRMGNVCYEARKDDEKVLLEAMRNKELDLSARLCVAGFLLDLGNEEARTFITDNLRTGDDGVVQDVGYTLFHHLGDKPDPWVVEQVVKLLEDDRARRGTIQGGVTEYICRRLGALKDQIPGAEDAIIDVLQRHHACGGAAEALGEIGDAKAVKALLETAEDNGKLNYQQAIALVKLKRVEITPILLAHLDDEVALDLLGDLKDPTSLGPIQKRLLEHQNDEQAFALTLAWTRVRATSSRDLARRLLETLANEKPRNQSRLLGELGKTREPMCIKPIVELARTSENTSVLMDCIFALCHIDGPEVVAGLIDLLDRDFVEQPNPRGKPSRQFRLREWVSEALKQKTGRAFGEDPAKWREWLRTREEITSTQPAKLAILPEARDEVATVPYRSVAMTLDRADKINDYKKAIDEIAALGADAVLCIVEIHQKDGESVDFSLGKGAPSPDQVGQVLAHAKEKKLRTLLQPIVLLDQPRTVQWRGTIVPADWGKWFANYREALDPWVRVAQQHDTDVFVVGSELVRSEERAGDWKETIAAVRTAFKGRLTYCANWDHYQNVPFWDQLDYVAMNSYWRLGKNRNVKVDEIVANWKKIQGDLLAFARKTGKPLLLTEVGWPSMANAAHEPWDYTKLNEPIDLALQDRLWEGFFQAWHGEPLLAGFAVYQWTPGQGGKDDRGHTPQGKPAEQTIRVWLAKPWQGTRPGTAPAPDAPRGAAHHARFDGLVKELAATRPIFNDDGNSPWSRLLNQIGKELDGEPEARLIELLSHENAQVRWLAAIRLGKLKSQAAVPQLLAMLGDREGDPRIGATWALGEIQDPRAAEEFIKIVEFKSTLGNRRGAIEALGKFATPRAIEALQSVTGDEVDYDAAEKALAEAGRRRPDLAKLAAAPVARPGPDLKADRQKLFAGVRDFVARQSPEAKVMDHQDGSLAISVKPGAQSGRADLRLWLHAEPADVTRHLPYVIMLPTSSWCTLELAAPEKRRWLTVQADVSHQGPPDSFLMGLYGMLAAHGYRGPIDPTTPSGNGANHRTDQPAWRGWWDERPAAKVITRGEAVAAAGDILAKSDFTRIHIIEAQFHPLVVATHYDPAHKTVVGRAESYQKEQARDVWVVNFSGASGNSGFQSWLLIEGGSGQQLAPGRMMQFVKEVTPEQLPAAMNRYKLVTPTVEYERRTFYLCYDGGKLPAGVKIGFTLDAAGKRQTWLLRMAGGKVVQAVATPIERVFVGDVTGDGEPNIVLGSMGEQVDPALRLPTFDVILGIDYSDGDTTIGEAGSGMFSRETRVFRAGDKLEELFSAPGGHGVSSIGTHLSVWADLYGNGTPVLCQVVVYGDFHLEHAKPEFSQELGAYWAKDAAGKWERVQVGKPIPTHQGGVDYAKLKGFIAGPATKPTTGPAAKADAREERPVAWGKAVEGLQAGLGVPRFGEASCAVGESASLEVVVRNTSDKPIRFTTFSPSFFAPTVHDPNGAAVRVTQPVFDGPVQAREHQLAPGTMEVLDAMRCAFAPGTGLNAGGGNIVHASPGVYKIRFTLRLTKHRDGDFDGELATGDLDFTVLEPDVKALTKRVADRLKGDVGTFVLKVVYLGDKQQGLRSLRLIAGEPKEQFPADWTTVRLDQKQAGAIIDYLGTAGYLTRWITDSHGEGAFAAPCYFLAIETGERSVGFTIPLGWGPPMQAKLAELREAMDGDARRGMDEVLRQLEPMKARP